MCAHVCREFWFIYALRGGAIAIRARGLCVISISRCCCGVIVVNYGRVGVVVNHPDGGRDFGRFYSLLPIVGRACPTQVPRLDDCAVP